MTLEIFGFAPSTYTQTVLLAAAEKGVSATLSPLDFGSDSHRALHPFVRMPAMKHGDVHLYESAAIVAYLDETFDGPPLQPGDAVDRARMWQYLSSAIDYFYGPLVKDTLNHDRSGIVPDPTERDRVLDVLKAGLGGRHYLVGEQLSLADLMVAPMVRFHVNADGNAGALAGRPAIAAWLERLGRRPGFAVLEAS